MGGSPQTGRASAPQGKTTESKGGIVGQPLKEKNKTRQAGGCPCASCGHPKAFGPKSRSAAFVRKPREGRF